MKIKVISVKTFPDGSKELNYINRKGVKVTAMVYVTVKKHQTCIKTVYE